MKLVFRFGRYKLNTFTNPKLKVKNFLSFSVSYIFAIIIIIIIIIIIKQDFIHRLKKKNRLFTDSRI